MIKRTFLIPSLLLAGFSAPAEATPTEAANDVVSEAGDADADIDRGASLFRQDRPVQFAGHSSHRSHSSHSSHRSSSSSGGYYPPATVYSPRPAPTPTPSPTPSYQRPKARTFGQPLNLLGSGGDQFSNVVKQVQLGLKAFGYFEGVANGTLGPDTRLAITKLQGDYNLKVTGTITPELLAALRIEP